MQIAKAIKEDIEKSLIAHKSDASAVEFLETQMDFCNSLLVNQQLL